MVTKPKQVTPKPKTPAQRLDEVGIDAICDHVSGGESLRSWCILNEFAYSTVEDWIDADTNRAMKYARARDNRADVVFDSLDGVSDAAVIAETAVEVAGLRLKADNIKWKLARMSPRKYGDKLAIGGDADMPPIKTITAEMTPQDAARAYADMIAAKK